MTKERKAQIARENGAKSKGPKTAAGKLRSSANSLAHGRRAKTLRHLAHPHPAVLCNEDGRAYFQLFHQLVDFYRPIGPVSLDIVREIAVARWELTRTQVIKAAAHNRAFLQEKHKEHKLPEPLIAVECAINATLSLFQTNNQLDRAIDRLLTRIARLERRLRYLQTNFPSLGTEIATCESEAKAYERTDDEPTQVVENTDTRQKPIITGDPSESTRAAYEYFFPGRELVVIEETGNE